MQEETVAKLNAKPNNIFPVISVGSMVEGKIIARDRASIFIDLGPQGTGIIYGREFYEAKDAIKNLSIGDNVVAKVVEMENEDGYRELSLRDATKDMSWRTLQEMKEKGEIVKVKIAGVNKGGLLANINEMPAFLPVSQLSPENYPRVSDADKQKILKELQKFIGKTMEVKILDLSPRENKLILSEKAKSEEAIKATLSNYKKGDVVEGRVTGIADFGVFVRFPADEQAQLGGEAEKPAAEPVSQQSADEGGVVSEPARKETVEGLIHISELDWQLVGNPAEFVKVGDIVKSQIININNNQVFLSLKSLQENPWEKVEKDFKKGDIIKGKIVALNSFGAFVEVMPKIRGLCHISEFKSQKEMEEALKIGETYDFEIVQIDAKEYRMSLKLADKKQGDEAQIETAAEK